MLFEWRQMQQRDDVTLNGCSQVTKKCGSTPQTRLSLTAAVWKISRNASSNSSFHACSNAASTTSASVASAKRGSFLILSIKGLGTPIKNRAEIEPRVAGLTSYVRNSYAPKEGTGTLLI